MALVQVVGTNGSGKSTVVREVMRQSVVSPEPVRDPVTGKVAGYTIRLLKDGTRDTRQVYVVGRYAEDVGTGGCDTMKSPVDVFRLLPTWDVAFGDVLFEGIRMMNHMRGVMLQQETRSLHVVHLTTSYEEVEKRIRARRIAAGGDPEKPLSADVRGTMGRADAYCRKVAFVGAEVVKASSESAPQVVLKMLGVLS